MFDEKEEGAVKGRNGKGDESTKLTVVAGALALIPEVPMGLLALLLSTLHKDLQHIPVTILLGTIRLAREFYPCIVKIKANQTKTSFRA